MDFFEMSGFPMVEVDHGKKTVKISKRGGTPLRELADVLYTVRARIGKAPVDEHDPIDDYLILYEEKPW